jgi:hypothetical protein
VWDYVVDKVVFFFASCGALFSEYVGFALPASSGKQRRVLNVVVEW